MTTAADNTKEVMGDKVHEIWEGVIKLCSKVLDQAEVYGVELMHIPDDPNIFKLERLLTYAVCPILDAICKKDDVPPDYGMKLDNIRQYAIHLRNIIRAIESKNTKDFDHHVGLLANEAMIL